jgi:hypothetical protein
MSGSRPADQGLKKMLVRGNKVLSFRGLMEPSPMVEKSAKKARK